jgi:bifunctional DNA-binding transcriptional regulator/antitoxin component of YhaV-PrlF toxin-antitoxin module
MANAIIDGMELTIDKFGRVVLPKKLRQHLGVGMSLTVEVTETAEGVLLKPVQRESGLMMKDGVLMLRGDPPGSPPIDWRKLIEEDREERIQHILNP